MYLKGERGSNFNQKPAENWKNCEWKYNTNWNDWHCLKARKKNGKKFLFFAPSVDGWYMDTSPIKCHVITSEREKKIDNRI